MPQKTGKGVVTVVTGSLGGNRLLQCGGEMPNLAETPTINEWYNYEIQVPSRKSIG